MRGAASAAGPGAALACTALLTLAGCGGPSFERAPRTAVDLGGHWVLDPAASDDAAAIIRKALPKPRRPNPAADALQPTDIGAGPQGGQRGDRRSQQGEGLQARQPTEPPWGRGSAGDFVRAFVLPPQHLEIGAQPGAITLAQGDRRRSFQPGDDEPLSVTDRFGSRTVRSGWDGETFTVLSTDGARLRILERYALAPHDRLNSVLEFGAPGMHTIKIHSAYRRATDAELAAPPPDGPPPRGPR